MSTCLNAVEVELAMEVDETKPDQDPQGDELWRWGFRFCGEPGKEHAKKYGFKRGYANKKSIAGGLSPVRQPVP